MRCMYDSVNASAIPVTAAMVAGYIDGRYAWSASDWARFPDAVRVRIAVDPATNDGHVLDVEPGDATPAQAVDWVRMRRAAGTDPAVYTGLSQWPQVRAAFQAAGVAEPHYWIAAYPGTGPGTIPDGAIAHQYADPATSGGHWDLSAVADYWPGVDPAPNVAPAAEGGFLMALEDWQQQRMFERILSMSQGVAGQDFDGDQFAREQQQRDRIEGYLANLAGQITDVEAALLGAIKAIAVGGTPTPPDLASLAKSITAALPAGVTLADLVAALPASTATTS